MTDSYLTRNRRTFPSDRAFIHYRLRQMGRFLLGQVQPSEEQTCAVIGDHYENEGLAPPRVMILPSPKAVFEAVAHINSADMASQRIGPDTHRHLESSNRRSRRDARLEECSCRLCQRAIGMAAGVANALASVVEFSHHHSLAMQSARGAIGLSRRTRERELGQLLIGPVNLDTHVWWGLAFQHVIYISEAPTSIILNEGEVHCANGPAITFADGSSYYVLRNLPVPACLIDQDWLTVERAESLPTPELRSMACNQIGWERVLAKKGARVIDDSGDPTWGRLLRLRDSRDPTQLLEARCGTGRTVVIPVPHDAATVEEAQSFLHGGLDPEILRAGVRT